MMPSADSPTAHQNECANAPATCVRAAAGIEAVPPSKEPALPCEPSEDTI